MCVRMDAPGAGVPLHFGPDVISGSDARKIQSSFKTDNLECKRRIHASPCKMFTREKCLCPQPPPPQEGAPAQPVPSRWPEKKANEQVEADQGDGGLGECIPYCSEYSFSALPACTPLSLWAAVALAGERWPEWGILRPSAHWDDSQWP